MNNKLQWDDLRLILAVAEAGSLSGAGRRLRVSHATVFRRLGAAEMRIGAKLFDRTRTGYVPTAAGEEAAAAARQIEIRVSDVERRVAGRDLRPSGIVRLTTTDSLFAGLVSPMLAEFRRRYPEIVLEVAISNDLFNLSKRDADVAIRPANAPPETLHGRKVGSIAQAIYGRYDLVRKTEAITNLRSMQWIGADEQMNYLSLDHWMAAQGLADKCYYRVDTVLGMLAATGDGAGFAVLPCYLGDADTRLVRIGAPIDRLATDLWLLTHADLRKTERIRLFIASISEMLTRRRDQLAGKIP